MSNTDSAPSASSALRYVLIVSLALNLFLAGLWAGLFGLHLLPGGPPGGEPFGERISGLVDEADKAKIAPNLTDLDTIVHKGWEGIGEARDKVVAVTAAESFDRTAFAAALATVRERDNAMRDAIDDEMAQILSRLPQAARAAIAHEIFSRRPPHAPR